MFLWCLENMFLKIWIVFILNKWLFFDVFVVFFDNMMNVLNDVDVWNVKL